MKAAVITIGDEILLGQITDTNSQWIARQLSANGISVMEIISIPDTREAILNTLEKISEEVDVAVSTGGLGPTPDDITKSTLAEFFDDRLVRNPGIEQKIRDMFAGMNFTPTREDLRQALLPSRAEILPNAIGTAAGMWLHKGNFQMISLPGVPQEMKNLMENEVLPRLVQRYQLPVILQRSFITYGLRESRMSERLAEFEAALPGGVQLAYLPNYRRLRLRLTVKNTRRKEAERLLAEYSAELEKRLEGITYGYENFSLEHAIGDLFREKNLSLAVAESFTGGNILATLTRIPGASQYLQGGIVAYHASVKIADLQVPKSLIERHSVVSAPVAEAMAEGIRKKYHTDYGIATTGNAGPSTDDTSQGVGDVFLAISSKSNTYSVFRNLGQPRRKVIDRGTSLILEMLYKEIRKKHT